MNYEIPLNADSIYHDHTFRIQFGDLCYAITCSDENISVLMQESYSVFRSDRPADIYIELNITDRLDRTRVETILSQKEVIPPEDLYKGPNPLIGIGFDTTCGIFSVNAERCLFDRSLKLKPMNGLFRLVYYTTSSLKNRGEPAGMLVHSCGILRNGEVSLFAGPSDIGKSTIGSLCSDDYGLPLNDEMVLLSGAPPPHRGMIAQSVPIFGELPFRLNTSAALARVLMLKQSQRIAIRRLDRKEAFLRFMYQIINPARFRQADKRPIISLIVDFTDKVTRVTPFYELEFTRDRKLLWEIEAKLSELNAEEVEYDRGSADAV